MVKKIKQCYKNMAVRGKIITVFVTILVFFMILVLIIPNIILYHSNIAKIEQSIQDECGMINLQISNLHNNLELCQNSTIQGINQVYEETETEQVNRISFISVKNSLSSVLNYYKSCFQDIDSLIFIDNQNNVVSAGMNTTPGTEEMDALIAEIPSFGPVNSFVFPVEKRAFSPKKQAESILTLGKRIIRIGTGENLGYLLVNVKTSSIAKFFHGNADEVYRKKFYILDARNEVIVSQNPEDELEKVVDKDFIQSISMHSGSSFQTTVDNKAVLVTNKKNHEFSWTLVNEVPIRDIMKDVYYMTIVIVAIGVLCIVMAVIFILVLSEMITNPIKELTETADKISAGELSCRCVVDRKDEVGVLSKTFNTMLERIQMLLNQVKEEQKRKRETELALFQVQIKPHFLYNTLDLIYVCCEMDDGKIGGKIAKALADYYRTCLSGGEEVVSIGEELRNIENYLFIQKERYSDIINYKISAPEECLKYKLPKMTLQPLVENAIYHGLKEKEGQGCVTIRAKEQGDTVILTVEDDGAGMEPRMFDELLQKSDEKEKKHFGLKNVHERIKLYFGESYGLSIDKEKKEGTSIRIVIPKVEAYDD
ncbi:sensor histidine kinase [Blautia schinkii]|nr:sensor histidine kinase [Blautia schinkii]